MFISLLKWHNLFNALFQYFLSFYNFINILFSKLRCQSTVLAHYCLLFQIISCIFAILCIKNLFINEFCQLLKGLLLSVDCLLIIVYQRFLNELESHRWRHLLNEKTSSTLPADDVCDREILDSILLLRNRLD